MLFLKYLFLVAGFILLGTSAALVGYDVYLASELRRLLGRGPEQPEPQTRRPIHWQLAGKLLAIGLLPALLGLSIVVVPPGTAGVRVSQISGVRPGTLYPGVHFITPLVQSFALYDIREQVFATSPGGGKGKAPELSVETQEGLSLGLTVIVRYRLDPRRLDYVHANLSEPISDQIVAPVVASAFRDAAPNYLVREAFSTKREEFRQLAAGRITGRLAADGIVVKEVLLREIQLPTEYAEGLEGLLLKEQENDRMVIEQQIREKQVRIAELESEAAKMRQIKKAEADAQTRVLLAKSESDSMQYTLPLKQKQVEQTRLEAQARKEETIQNAEAMAQAKIIDSRAEQQRLQLLADAEANRIRVVSVAEAEQLRLEAIALKSNPLLIQKIIAERLSDKLQIVMVPTDGKFFFANDVLRAAPFATDDGSAKDQPDPPARPRKP